MTTQGTDTYGGQLSYSADSYAASVTYATYDTPATDTTYLGLNAYWAPEETGTAVPSISVGYETGNPTGTGDDTSNWFAGMTTGEVGPGSINLGKEFNTYDIEVTKVGDGELSVANVENDIPSAITITQQNVDENGFGTYRITLDRSSLPDGLYSTKTKVTFSNDNIQSTIHIYTCCTVPRREIRQTAGVRITICGLWCCSDCMVLS